MISKNKLIFFSDEFLNSEIIEEHHFSAFLGGFTDQINSNTYMIFVKEVSHVRKIYNRYVIHQIESVVSFKSESKKISKRLTDDLNRVKISK